MSTDKDLANTDNAGGTDQENKENIDLTDHPGLEKKANNPNPRANENLPGSESDPESKPEADDTTDEVGSEITDGGAG